MNKLLAMVLLVGIGVGALAFYRMQEKSEPEVRYRTSKVVRDDLVSTISATGTVEPEEVVDVGAQVMGRVRELGEDVKSAKKSIDYCSEVQEGTVLAWIDDTVYQAQVRQAEATLRRAEADLLQMKAKTYQTEQEWKRAKSLQPSNAISDTDYDLVKANFESAKANQAVGEAMIAQAQASLKLAETNLGYTVIKSPVKGVIIDRRVNVGQTVVASLNAPSLFLIAKDLSRVQVWASVNEADIGRIQPGLSVRFTVDTYPNEYFYGKVIQVRLNAQMTQNVVTYTVVVGTDNADKRLLPYLTANLQFEIEKHPQVLLVPNSALRWKPRPELILPTDRKTEQPVAVKKKEELPKKSEGEERASAMVDHGQIWLKTGSYVRPMEVIVGASDGALTEISCPELEEGMEVVYGEIRKDELAEEVSNPFGPPKLFGPRPK